MCFTFDWFKQLLWFWVYITGISSRLCSHTKAYCGLGMTMTSSELLPSVMSATWTFRKLGLLCQLYAPPFQQRTLVHPKPWQTVDAGVGFSFEPCSPTPAVFFCLGAARQKAPVVREQLSINCLASLTSTATAWPVFGSSWGIFRCIEPVTDMWGMSNYSILHVYLSRDAENGFQRGLDTKLTL